MIIKLFEQFENDNTQKIASYLEIDTFKELPYEYQKSLIIFIDGNDYIDVNKKYYYGLVPMKLLQDEVAKRLGWDNFTDYHKWYGDEETDHGDSVLPIIINFNDEELIVDGWHRFHSYVRKGLSNVPVIMRVNLIFNR